MPIPFDIIAVMLFLGYYSEAPAAVPPPPEKALAVVIAACAAMFAGSAAVNWIVLRRLRRGRVRHGDRSRLAGAADAGLRVLLVVVYITALEESRMPWSLAAAFGWHAASGSFAVQALGLIPYVLLFFAAWIPMYGLHRETSPGVWTRRGFLVHKARYNLFMLVPWILFALLADWLSGILAVMPVLFLAAAWSFPWLLARAWGCKPLSGGPILEAVGRLQDVAGVKFSRVYLWEPGGGMQNAAAVGIFRPFRYLFLTPALIGNMTGRELEAVILHELGHVKKRHLLFYFFTTLAGINVAVLMGAVIPLTGTAERFLVTTALIIGYFRFVFGLLSRNMERQADLFALEKTGDASGLANALEKLGLAAGNIRNAASWHHLGIAERTGFLRRAERDPSLVKRHNARVSLIMAGGCLASLAVMTFVGWLLFTELGSPAAAGGERRRTGEGEAHWRRVKAILPANPTALIELAHCLAARSDSRDEAAELAGRVMRLVCANGEKAAAARLLDNLGVELAEGTRDGERCN